MVRSILLFVSFAASIVSAEWVSPHDLKVEEEAPRSLIPFPQKVVWGKGIVSIPLTTPCAVRFEGHGVAEQPDYKKLKQLFPQSQMDLEHSRRVAPVVVRLDTSLAPLLGKEGYKIDIANHKIILSAPTKAGLFYAGQTLRQLGKRTLHGQNMVFPEVSIIDVPAFAYRGCMHDVGRDYQTIDELKNQIDMMSHFKLNVLQLVMPVQMILFKLNNASDWYLMPHPAWRVQSYHNEWLLPNVAARYTFDELRDLIAYAKDRQVLVIPTLDMSRRIDVYRGELGGEFGCEMTSPKGTEIVKNLWEDFCREIPKESCPILHIGVDGYRELNPSVADMLYIENVTKKVQELNRMPMTWRSGASPKEGAIVQIAGGGPSALSADKETRPFIDSSMPNWSGLEGENRKLIVQKYFFKQYCGRPLGDAAGLGAVAKLRPDVRVGVIDKYFQLPSLFAFADRVWKGCAEGVDKLPVSGTEAHKAFELFEKRVQEIVNDKRLKFAD